MGYRRVSEGPFSLLPQVRSREVELLTARLVNSVWKASPSLLPGKPTGDFLLGAEWFDGHQCLKGLWVLLLLPSLEVSRTLNAPGSADAGDRGDVGAQKLP